MDPPRRRIFLPSPQPPFLPPLFFLPIVLLLLTLAADAAELPVALRPAIVDAGGEGGKNKGKKKKKKKAGWSSAPFVQPQIGAVMLAANGGGRRSAGAATASGGPVAGPRHAEPAPLAARPARAATLAEPPVAGV